MRARRPTYLPKSLSHRLDMYATAAVAAATLVGSPQSAKAEIVYTPDHVTLQAGKLPIDLNGDGVVDFELTDFGYRSGTAMWRVLNITGAVVGSTHNAVEVCVRQGCDGASARALQAGAVIGPTFPFYEGKALMAWGRGEAYDSIFYTYGLFKQTTDRFAGLRFTVNGEIHYGWAAFRKVKLAPGIRVTAQLVGFAYETEPGKAIVAGDKGPSATLQTPPAPADPQPASLGVLALGAPGLSIWRRE